MKLKLKTFLVVGVSMTLFIIMQVLYLSPLLLKEAEKLDNDYALQELKIIDNAIASKLDSLGIMNRDWAHWDDTYDFTINRNTAYIESNLGYETLESNEHDFMLFINKEGKVVYQEGYNVGKNEKRILRETFYKTFLQYIDNKEEISERFLVNTEYGLAMTSIESIYRSEGTGDSPGVLIIGRMLDSYSVNEIGDALSLNLSLESLNNATAEQFTLSNVNEEILAGELVVKDYTNTYAYKIKTDIPRNFYIEKKGSVSQITFYLTTTSLFFMLLIIILLNYYILNPLSDLSFQLDEIQKKKDLRARIKRKRKANDELTALSNSINRTLSSLEETHKEITDLAYFDQLTKLPNRYMFFDEFEKRFKKLDQFALIFFDLDGFKRVNDTFGHEIGDLLLKEVSNRIQPIIQNYDGLLARYAGDEFVILLNDKNKAILEDICDKILSEVKKEYQLASFKTLVTASIGISVYPEDGVTLDELLRNADASMYEAKRKGKNQHSFFQDLASDSEYNTLIELENDLKYALANKEFELHYQPIIAGNDNKLVGVEALLRWNHARKGIISPSTFIPIAEENGLMPQIGRWVFAEALKQGKSWKQLGFDDLVLSINISKSQMSDFKLLELMDELINDDEFHSSNILFEITESDVSHYIKEIRQFIESVKERGVKIALDDFGIGTSSLIYLKELPFDVIKVDRNFIVDITTQHFDQILLDGIFGIVKGLQLEVVVEGIEKEEQLKYIRSRINAKLQGFYFSRPLPARQFEQEFLGLVPLHSKQEVIVE